MGPKSSATPLRVEAQVGADRFPRYDPHMSINVFGADRVRATLRTQRS